MKSPSNHGSKELFYSKEHEPLQKSLLESRKNSFKVVIPPVKLVDLPESENRGD